jgi:hypothetical protein
MRLIVTTVRRLAADPSVPISQMEFMAKPDQEAFPLMYAD